KNGPELIRDTLLENLAVPGNADPGFAKLEELDKKIAEAKEPEQKAKLEKDRLAFPERVREMYDRVKKRSSYFLVYREQKVDSPAVGQFALIQHSALRSLLGAGTGGGGAKDMSAFGKGMPGMGEGRGMGGQGGQPSGGEKEGAPAPADTTRNGWTPVGEI